MFMFSVLSWCHDTGSCPRESQWSGPITGHWVSPWGPCWPLRTVRARHLSVRGELSWVVWGDDDAWARGQTRPGQHTQTPSSSHLNVSRGEKLSQHRIWARASRVRGQLIMRASTDVIITRFPAKTLPPQSPSLSISSWVMAAVISRYIFNYCLIF